MGDTLLGVAGLSRARLALAGKSGSGKSTLARVLSQLLDVPVYSFAAPIKEALRAMGYREPFPRHLMQAIGDLMRGEDPDFFIKLLEERLADTGAIIDDLRYPNELAWCREKGFMVVYLRGSFQPLSGKLAAHSSENGLDESAADVVLDEGEVSQRLRLLLREIADVADLRFA